MNQHSSIDKLIKLNEEGVIPRENETESSFFKRVEKDKPSFNYSYCKKNLSFYEMACVIVDEAKVEVFLHPIFEKKENFLGISKQEIIDHEKNGLLVEPNSSYSINAALEKCMSNLDWVEKARIMSIATVDRKFSWQKVVDKCLANYAA